MISYDQKNQLLRKLSFYRLLVQVIFRHRYRLSHDNQSTLILYDSIYSLPLTELFSIIKIFYCTPSPVFQSLWVGTIIKSEDLL